MNFHSVEGVLRVILFVVNIVIISWAIKRYFSKKK